MKKFLIISSFTFILAACNSPTINQSSPENQIKTTKIDASHQMMNHQISISSDLDFIINMIPHHQEAVDSSSILLAKTSNPELKKFLQNVIDVQSDEIKQMREWSSQWFKDQKVGMGIYTNMMPSINNLPTEDAEKAYIKGMIEHHRGAIEMAEQILKITEKNELKTMANNIIETQNKEIELLQSWSK